MSAPFDLAGALPHGVTVLEAGAGTGKTYAIAGLVVRYVAGGTRLPRLLVVTFTRAATAKLRDRVRRRIGAAADHLSAVLAGATPPTDDAVCRLLASDTPHAIQLAHRRLVAALAEFDAATITTIHGFCQQVLASVGLAGDVDRGSEVVQADDDVLSAVVDDLLVGHFSHGQAGSPPRRGDLLAIGRAAADNPGAVLLPAAPQQPDAAQRLALACQIRDQTEQRKRATGVLSYDDVLTRLAATLRDPIGGASARARLRDQYELALIDEFQDTDPVQWDIFQRTFGGRHGTLVLIGDPKQAIYAFRGADVFAYLEAAAGAATKATLDVNWRSDAALLTAFNVLFEGATLGHGDIAYRPAQPSPSHHHARLTGGGAPLRLRVVTRDPRLRQSRGTILADAARLHVAADVAAQTVALLEGEARIAAPTSATTPRPVPDTPGRGQAVRPGDIAVLVRTNAEAALVQRQLRGVGVPAVINGVGSVFATAAATDWLRLLDALERPAAPGPVRIAALTLFLGWSAAQVAAADDHDWEQLHQRCHAWAGVLQAHGVAALLRTITVQQDIPARLLARTDGERLLTDVEHIGELLHAMAATEQFGPAALAGWLRLQVAQAQDDIVADERARRLESDAAAVQVLTIHRSKGLEFAIVFCPFLWASPYINPAVPVFHDADHDRQRTVDVGGPAGSDFDDHLRQASDELHAEQLRLLYVALTRAKHQVLLWWAPASFSERSPLGRLLFARRPDGRANPRGRPSSPPTDDSAVQRLTVIAERGAGAIAVERVPAQFDTAPWSGHVTPAGPLAAATFDRTLDHAWRRTSYSGLTAAAEHAVVTSEPDEAVTSDEALDGEGVATETSVEAPAQDEAARLLAVACPLTDMPGGVEPGTFVHGVLEHTDFAAAALHDELTRQIAAQQQRRAADIGDPARLAAGLLHALQTPLGPLLDQRCLADFTRADRLDELVFELPLPGAGDLVGDAALPGGVLTVAAIGDVLAAHISADDLLAGYPRHLTTDPAFDQAVRGYLTGSIDLVVRVGHGVSCGADQRYVVVDYKTNRLARADEALTAWHFRPAALTPAMVRGHYPLQALLYTVALHRYLRWRLADYDPDRNLGGAVYAFLRGMTGADTPRVDGQPCGVVSWRPATALIVAVSDVLDRGTA